jgi:enoyl-CoA hydratase/carnithine racemase
MTETTAGTVPDPTTGTDQLLVDRDGGVLTLTFNRPAQRNAMTWEMYDGLVRVCELADGDDDVRVVVLRAAGENAFVAGTDIAQFRTFSSGEDGVAYERRIGEIMTRLLRVSKPTVASVRGFCVGAGLAIAAACDLRVGARGSRYGAPIARTLGNCLAEGTTALLVHHLGPSRTADLVMRARLFTAEEMHAAGFLNELCDEADLEAATREVVDTLLGHAPLTVWAAKTTLRRLALGPAGEPSDQEVVARVYGSEDFRAGVAAFASKRTPDWQGR